METMEMTTTVRSMIYVVVGVGWCVSVLRFVDRGTYKRITPLFLKIEPFFVFEDGTLDRYANTTNMNQEEKECYDCIRYLTQVFENSPPRTVERVSVVLGVLQCLYDYYDIWTQGTFVKRAFPEVAFNKIREFREYDYTDVPDISENLVRSIHEVCDEMLGVDEDIIG
jgi:hypothetical protein